MEIDRKDTNIQIGKRLREARTNMNKDKAEFAATLDVTEQKQIPDELKGMSPAEIKEMYEMYQKLRGIFDK